MKRIHLALISLVFAVPSVFGGGLMTNTNQSAAWARTLTREATLDVDAVYFNPAGLVQMNNGLHLSISNQSIFQTRQVISDYPLIEGTPKTYEAELTAPFFPSIYAAFKKDKWAFSAGFNVIGGGGSANFETGLPSFEIPVANLVPMLQQQLVPLDQAIEGATGNNPGFANVTGYNMEAAFNGSSNYFGIQAGATYAITDMISVALGGRYVMATNTYEGSLTNITVDAPAAYGGAQPAGDYLRFISGVIRPLNPPAADAVDDAANTADALTADKYLDAVQKGSGFTPIVGVNFHITDMVNVAARYEHHTKIEMTNETEVDDVGMFPDGEKTRGDLPGMFALGAKVNPIGKLTLCAGFTYYLDKPAYYGNTDENGEQINNETTIDNNKLEYSVSAEFKFLGILGVSVGYLGGNFGVNDGYQSDMSYSNNSNTIGGGLFVDIGEIATINAGYTRVMYDDYKESYSVSTTNPFAYSDTYTKSTSIFAIGVDIHL